MRVLISFSLLMLLSVSTAAQELGQQIAIKGKGAGACVACHGENGAGIPVALIPRIAGLPAQYIVRQLNLFDGQIRENVAMHPIASGLNRKEKVMVASYFANLSLPSWQPEPILPQAQITLAKARMENYDSQRDLPACFACHGPDGVGVGNEFPSIIGQSSGYLKQQLISWQSGGRAGDPNALMTTVAKKLTLSEIEAISAYLASLPLKR